MNVVVALSLLAGGLCILAASRRTRGYSRIDPQLRSPIWRVRTPSFGPLVTRLSRKGPATRCVEGVDLSSYQVVSEEGTPVTVYVYRPAGIGPRSAAMLYTHGGGMITSSAAGYHVMVSAYARDLGIPIVSTEYRLAPEHPFPAPLDDVHAAYRWLVANAAMLDVDLTRIAVGGESAGGGLTAALCQRLYDLGEHQPRFQLLIYPMIDDRTTLRRASHYRGQLVWSEKSNLYGWTSYLGRKPTAAHAPKYAAPARRLDLAGLPPAWIGVGTLDLFYDEDVAYAKRLQECGVPCELDIVEGAFHGFDLVMKTNPVQAFRGRILAACRANLGL